MARWDGQIAEALVRSQKNTKDDEEEVTLAPICNTVQDKCGSEDKLSIPFNTRSYFQAKYNGSCDATPFGTGTYECVDYDQGALRLGGQTLSFEVDLSNDGCGCNAALYLVSMPQSHDESICHDRYCDANNVCGVRCTELDLMEANQIAWVSTVHVADDGSGQGFGYAHYVFPPEHRLSSPTHECAYGPSATCAIDTRSAFVAAISFSAPEELFSCAMPSRGLPCPPVTFRDLPWPSVASDGELFLCAHSRRTHVHAAHPHTTCIAAHVHASTSRSPRLAGTLSRSRRAAGAHGSGRCGTSTSPRWASTRRRWRPTPRCERASTPA